MTKQIVQQAIDMLTSQGKLGKLFNTSGENFIYSCPFTANHSGRTEQRTPSFGIQEETGQWNCFSCHRRGPDIYVLYSALMGISDEEAKNTIGEPKFSANMVLAKLEALRKGEDDLRPRPMEPYPNTVPAYKHHASASYLRQRGVPEWLAEKVGLGYCDEYMLPTFSGKAGMSGKRIIIPLEYEGQIVGYSGRSVFPNSFGPKYYRPVSHVNSMIYAPTNPDPKVVKSIFVVEGEFSLYACLREGLPTACTFGADMSQRQAEYLARFDQVLMTYDPDLAGDIGAAKAYAYLNGFTQVRKLILPGKDPAEMAPGYGSTLMAMANTRPQQHDKLGALKQLLEGK